MMQGLQHTKWEFTYFSVVVVVSLFVFGGRGAKGRVSLLSILKNIMVVQCSQRWKTRICILDF